MFKERKREIMGAEGLEKNVFTACGICNAACGMRVCFKQGKIVALQGSKEHPYSRGYLCAKGRSMPELLDSSERVRHPLKKDEKHWRTISWSEALNTIGEKLSKIKEIYGPQALAVHIGQAGVKKQFTPYAKLFARLYGTPNFSTAGSHCHISRAMASVVTFGCHPEPDFANSRCIVLWGSNPAVSDPPVSELIIRSRRKGACLIVIDPHQTRLAREADLHLRVRPGTDGALALGFINLIIANGAYDHQFVREWTIGFERLGEAVKAFTPEKVALITGVPAEKIIQAAGLYASSHPACIAEGNAMELHTNGFQAARAISVLQAICGNLDVKGGAIFIPPLLAPLDMEKETSDIPAVGQESYPVFYKHTNSAQANLLSEAILEDKPYGIKSMIIAGSNPLLTWPNANKLKQALMKLDFLVVMEHFMTDTARLADLVLPAATSFGCYEMWEKVDDDGRLIAGLAAPIIDEGECRSNWWLWKALAVQMGYGDHFPWQNEAQALNARLEKRDLSIDLLRGYPNGYVYGQWEGNKYQKNGFATPSGKVEIFSEELERFGYPALPAFTWDKVHLAPEYPLLLSSGARSPEFMHSRFHNLESLNKRCAEPLLDMNPQTAGELNISSGDMVKLESENGFVEIRVRYNTELDSGVVLMPHGWAEANANLLTGDRVLDPVTGFPADRSVAVWVSRA